MTEYKLQTPFLEIFNAALKQDDAIELIKSINDAAVLHVWPACYWNSIRIASLAEGATQPLVNDMVRTVAISGKPTCFLAALRFVFQNPDWKSLSEEVKNGRIGRFPLDVECYIPIRFAQLEANDLVNLRDLMTNEISAVYDIFFALGPWQNMSSVDNLFEKIAQSLEDQMVKKGPQLEAQLVRNEILKSLQKSNSEARASAEKRLWV